MGIVQAILSAPVACTLPLLDLIKIRPELWNDIATCLSEQVLLQKSHHECTIHPETKHVLPIPINKVGKFCEDDQGNATLPLEVRKVASTAILDSGAGVGLQEWAL